MKVEFEVRTAKGRVIFTSPNSDLALKHFHEHRATYPGLSVESVKTITIRQTLRVDRAPTLAMERAS